MKLCPNCKIPFEEKAGLLFCKDHGWHGLNDHGEIIPADEPTAEQLSAWEQAQKESEQGDAADQVQPEIVDDPAAPSVIDDQEQPSKIVFNENAVLTVCAIVGAIIIVLAVYGIIRRRKRDLVHG